LKVKPYFDAEARVVAHIPGQGKHLGRLGALEVLTPHGVAFRIGTGFSDEQREAPPPVGSWVTYRYQGTTKNGIPRFASFLRMRE
jgi:DNA ligase-1